MRKGKYGSYMITVMKYVCYVLEPRMKHYLSPCLPLFTFDILHRAPNRELQLIKMG